MSKTKSYKCANCLEEFDAGWSDEEASVEFNQDFSGFDIADAEVVCDDCYKEMVAWKKPKALVEEQ